MSLSAHFDYLGARLKNVRWSWGAVRADGTMFLRVWQDEIRRQDGVLCSQLTHHGKFADKPDDRGYQERTEQVELLRGGARCYLVMCIAEDVTAVPRAIKGFDADVVYPGSRLLELDGEVWVEMLPRVPVRQVLSR